MAKGRRYENQSGRRKGTPPGTSLLSQGATTGSILTLKNVGGPKKARTSPSCPAWMLEWFFVKTTTNTCDM